MKRTIALASAIGVLAWIVLTGCAAEHLTASYGLSSNAYHARQIVNPEAGKVNVVSVGLDCNEAAIVAKNYYQSLVAEGTSAEAGQQVLIVTPNKESETKLPAPSVPDGTR